MLKVLTDEAKQAVFDARSSARARGNHFVGTLHLLESLTAHDTNAAFLLRDHGVTPEIAYCAMDAFSPTCRLNVPQGIIPYTYELENVLHDARKQKPSFLQGEFESPATATDELLLTLVSRRKGAVQHVLRQIPDFYLGDFLRDTQEYLRSSRRLAETVSRQAQPSPRQLV